MLTETRPVVSGSLV